MKKKNKVFSHSLKKQTLLHSPMKSSLQILEYVKTEFSFSVFVIASFIGK